MNPGFYLSTELTNEAYHRSAGVSNSGLKLIGDRTPKHFHANYIAPRGVKKRVESRPMFVGTAMHAACLEPDVFSAQYIVADSFKTRRDAGYKAWAAKQSRLILMDEEHDNVLGMRESLFAHPEAGALIRDVFEFEYSAYAVDPETGVLVRIRMDCFTQGGWIVDLKKTQDASPAAAAKTISNYLYYHQSAFYTDVLEMACGEPPAGFKFVMIEEQAPHCVGVYEVVPEDRQRGRELYRRNLSIYARCLERNEWPAYSPVTEFVELPRYERSRVDILLIKELYE